MYFLECYEHVCTRSLAIMYTAVIFQCSREAVVRIVKCLSLLYVREISYMIALRKHALTTISIRFLSCPSAVIASS